MSPSPSPSPSPVAVPIPVPRRRPHSHGNGDGNGGPRPHSRLPSPSPFPSPPPLRPSAPPKKTLDTCRKSPNSAVSPASHLCSESPSPRALQYRGVNRVSSQWDSLPLAASTTPPLNTTRAASASSPSFGAAPATTSSAKGSKSFAGLATAAPRAPIRARVTARAFSFKSRTPFTSASFRTATSSSRSPGTTGSCSVFSPAIRRGWTPRWASAKRSSAITIRR